MHTAGLYAEPPNQMYRIRDSWGYKLFLNNPFLVTPIFEKPTGNYTVLFWIVLEVGISYFLYVGFLYVCFLYVCFL